MADGNEMRPAAWQQPQSMAEMGPSVRGQFWPTFPRQSRNPNTWSVIKYYSALLDPLDADNALNQVATRPVRFDLPVTVLAWNAGVNISDGSGFPIGWSPLDTFEIKFSTVGGENLTIHSALAGGVVGTGQRPGFCGGGGWPFGPGSSLICEITPRLAGLQQGAALRIHLSFMCLQTRMGSSTEALAVTGGNPSGGGI